jgi:hypothetical protein
VKLLQEGDIIIDGGNSEYTDTTVSACGILSFVSVTGLHFDIFLGCRYWRVICLIAVGFNCGNIVNALCCEAAVLYMADLHLTAKHETD